MSMFLRGTSRATKHFKPLSLAPLSTSKSLCSEAEKKHPWPDYVRRWAHGASRFNQYGLYHDDCLYETEDVIEAIRRLPPTLQVKGNRKKP